MSSSKAVKSSQIRLSDSSASFTTTLLSTGVFGVVVGEIVERQADGAIFVDYPSSGCGPVMARTLIEEVFPGAKVLLAFERGLPALPIVLGIVHDRAKIQGRTLHLEADRIILNARDEVSIQCGAGGLQATRNGNIHLKGKDIVSHATRTNKVRGATVRIN